MPAPLVVLGIAGLAGGAGYAAVKSNQNSAAQYAQKQQEQAAQDASAQIARYEAHGGGGVIEERPDNFYQGTTQEAQTAFKPTNVAWLDEKLKSGTATGYDAYVAKNLYGMNLGDYGDQTHNVKMDAKLSLKKDLDELKNLANANLNIDQAIGLSKDNLGLGGAWDRWWNDKTGKFADMSDENARFYAAHYDTIKAKAKADKGGKPSNQDIKDLEKVYGIGASSELNYLERMYQMKFDTTEKMYQGMKALEAQGRTVPPEIYAEWKLAEQGLKELKQQLEAMQQGKQKKFTYDKWYEIQTRRAYDPANTQTARQNKTAQTQNGYVDVTPRVLPTERD